MSISFPNLPSDVRVPLFYADIDNSMANSNSSTYYSLIIAPMDASGTGTANEPVLCSSYSNAKSIGGDGSVLALMVDAYTSADDFGTLYVLPLAPDSDATFASGTIQVTNPADETGTIYLYVAGTLVQITATSSQTSATVASNICTKINANTSLPVMATVSGATVTLVSKTAGTVGNQIDIRLNYYGTAGGESLPDALALTITAMSGGAGDPDLSDALANLLDKQFDFICMPYTDDSSLNEMKSFLSTKTGRWAWDKQLYGHCFTAMSGTLGTLTTFGTTRNDEHVSIMGVYDSPTPTWVWAADICGTAAVALRNDPARPLQSLTLATALAPPVSSRFDLSDRNTLLWDGISTYSCNSDSSVNLENVITTYQTNSYGSADDSYLEVETLYTLAYVLRRMKSAITSNFPRSKLGNSSDTYDPNANVVTTATIKSYLLAEYKDLVYNGYCQNYDEFASALDVERNADNVNRVDVLWPGVLINQLRIFALLAQFRLS